MTSKKIIVKIYGGLGNQLFVYAAARRLALKSKAELIIDSISGFAYDKRFRRSYQLGHFNILCRKATKSERMEPFGRIRHYLSQLLNHLLPLEHKSYLVQKEMDYDPGFLNFRPTRNLYLQGYWQSEKYFKDVEPLIRRDLVIHPPTDIRNLTLAKLISRCTAVAVHVRFFDEPISQKKAKPNNVTSGYYARAVEYIESQLDAPHYFIFSDRPEAALKCIDIPVNRFTLVCHNQGDDNAYADLWLMTLCQHFIIANSTFSWWGAWLASHPGKIIIAPGFEKRDGITHWGFDGLLPTSWLKL
jgi:hypothetical protein